MELNVALLEELTQAWGVSGHEKAVREIVRREAAPYADEMTTDALGNLIVLKKGAGGGKKIMLSAHMDEIGAQVTKIEADGRIRICRVGWLWTAAMYNDKVIFRNGTVGVVSSVCNIEEAHNDPTKLFVDIGCTTKEQVEQYVRVGDCCGFIGPFHHLQNDCVCAKSLDDRAGCWLLLEALRRNDGTRGNDVYYVFSVQEEVGCRGAAVAAERIHPDIGVSVDVTPDHFYPCDLEGSNAVGAGVGVKLGDPSAMLDETLVERMLACCEENGIAYQRDVMDRGGTDAGPINRSGIGVRVAAVALVDRYAHSQSSIISLRDARAAVELLDRYTALTFAFEE